MNNYIITLIVTVNLVCFSLMHSAFALDPVVLDTDIEYDALKEHLLKRYTVLVEQLAAGENAGIAAMQLGLRTQANRETEENFTPWWQQKVSQPIINLPSTVTDDITKLFAKALKHSSQIKVFADIPLIRRTTKQEAEGVFDTRFFADGHFSETDEPVDNTLKTGGDLTRYEEETSGITFGLRRKFLPGTEIEIEQQFNRFDNNSEYLDPQDQSRTQTGITITQPLLQGFGPKYNSASEVLAEIDTSSANQELKRQVTGHLQEIVRSYWSLYMERSIYLQKAKLAQKTKELYEKMAQRVEIDIQPSLLARAKSQMQSHQLDADEAKFAILNAQSKLWALINSPTLVHSKGIEMVTEQAPIHFLPQESMLRILETALQNRPEIDQSIHQLQAAAVRHYRSKNELFPDLNLYANAYVSGLNGDYDDGDAFDQEWNEGDPSYRIGLQLEFPLLNNSARAQVDRKKLEVRQLLNQLDTTVTNVLLEAQISYREMIKNHMAMIRRFEVMKSSEEEINDLINRIDVQLVNNAEYGTILYQLLDAIERQNESELEFSTSELTYNYSLYQLKSAKGILLMDNKVALEEQVVEVDNLPINTFFLTDLKIFDGSINQ